MKVFFKVGNKTGNTPKTIYRLSNMWLEEKLGKTRHWVFLGRTAIVIDFCLFFKYFFKRPPEKKTAI